MHAINGICVAGFTLHFTIWVHKTVIKLYMPCMELTADLI